MLERLNPSHQQTDRPEHDRSERTKVAPSRCRAGLRCFPQRNFQSLSLEQLIRQQLLQLRIFLLQFAQPTRFL